AAHRTRAPTAAAYREDAARDAALRRRPRSGRVGRRSAADCRGPPARRCNVTHAATPCVKAPVRLPHTENRVRALTATCLCAVAVMRAGTTCAAGTTDTRLTNYEFASELGSGIYE